MENDHDTWRELNAKIGSMSEDDVKTALNHEISTGNRKSVVLRLHQRFTKLRMFREREAIYKGELL